MTPDEIRSTERIVTGRYKTEQEAVGTAPDFWLREIAAQLAEIAVYLQHQAAGVANVCAQLEAFETTMRMIGVRLQDAQDQAASKAAKKSPVPAGGGKRGGD